MSVPTLGRIHVPPVAEPCRCYVCNGAVPRLVWIDRGGNRSTRDWPGGLDTHQSRGPIGHRSGHFHAWQDRLRKRKIALTGPERRDAVQARAEEENGRG